MDFKMSISSIISVLIIYSAGLVRGCRIPVAGDAQFALLHQQWLSSIGNCADSSLVNSPVFRQTAESTGQLVNWSSCNGRNGHKCETEDRRCASCHNQALYGEDSCPAPASSNKLEDRSICPYFWVSSSVETRYPVMVSEAKCRCTQCQHPGISSGFDTGCNRVFHSLPFLYATNATDENGFCIYESKLAQVSVGCTCFVE